jgi:hypothetical protein
MDSKYLQDDTNKTLNDVANYGGAGISIFILFLCGMFLYKFPKTKYKGLFIPTGGMVVPIFMILVSIVSFALAIAYGVTEVSLLNLLDTFFMLILFIVFVVVTYYYLIFKKYLRELCDDKSKYGHVESNIKIMLYIVYMLIFVYIILKALVISI